MNGTIRTCYDYYSSIGDEVNKAKYNNEAVAGSQTNPYALEDAFDWCNLGSTGPSMININGSTTNRYPFFEVVKDIDINDCGKQTIFSSSISTKFTFSQIEGNGHNIYNLSAILQNYYFGNTGSNFSSDKTMMNIERNSTPYAYDSSVINNLNFINIIRYDSYTSLFGFAASYLHKIIFNNCNFTIYEYNKSATYGEKIFYHGLAFNSNNTSGMIIYNYCTFNVKASVNVSRNPYKNYHNFLSDDLKTTFNYCHINIEYLHGVNPFGIINYGNYNFSYITITINYLGQDDINDNCTYNLFKVNDYSSTSSSSDVKCPYYFRGGYIYIKIKSNSSVSNKPYLKLSVPVGTDDSFTSTAIDNLTSESESDFSIIVPRVSITSFITVEDENKDNPDKAIDLTDFTKFPTPGFEEGVYNVGYEGSGLYYLTPENAKNYDVLSAISFPCLKIE